MREMRRDEAKHTARQRAHGRGPACRSTAHTEGSAPAPCPSHSSLPRGRCLRGVQDNLKGVLPWEGWWQTSAPCHWQGDEMGCDRSTLSAFLTASSGVSLLLFLSCHVNTQQALLQGTTAQRRFGEVPLIGTE